MTLRIALADTIPNITPSALRAHLSQTAPSPLHLPGLVSAWPALYKWTLSDGLRAIRDAVGEQRAVEVEVGQKGRGYLDQRYQRVTMGFGLFLDAFILSLIPSSSPDSLPTAYLAQSDLLEIPSVLKDVSPPLEHFSSGPRSEIWRRTIWIGPKGSWTPFHRDPYIGLYTQIIGSKRFRLLPPSASTYLKPSPNVPHTNTSTILLSSSNLLRSSLEPDILLPSSNLLRPDDELDADDDIQQSTIQEYREQLRGAFAQDGACQVTLKQGDSVLVPEGWWHEAEGLDGPGIGAGSWFR
ncbi:hypothetical protein BCR39DRAFT_350713 [Naematelia encephala]|uniref:JmjC domain-containing protein n=1 Tax=Naematelia encephala TaxID=71784 RepID=A0A1Y2BDL0_9TREE|nr:hypothetical protein BCR39DRAFT_350713 [Naematelia encephala]